MTPRIPQQKWLSVNPLLWALAIVTVLVFGAIAVRVLTTCEESSFELVNKLKVHLGGDCPQAGSDRPPLDPGAGSEAMTQEQQARALQMIADFADKLCRDVPVSGTGSNAQLSSEAKSDLSKMIKELQGKDSTKLQPSTSEAAGQRDLQGNIAQSLSRDANCKLHVFEALKTQLLGAQQ